MDESEYNAITFLKLQVMSTSIMASPGLRATGGDSTHITYLRYGLLVGIQSTAAGQNSLRVKKIPQGGKDNTPNEIIAIDASPFCNVTRTRRSVMGDNLETQSLAPV